MSRAGRPSRSRMLDGASVRDLSPLEDVAVRLSNRVVPILSWVLGALVVVCVLSFSLAFYLYRVSTTLPDLGVNPDAIKTARTSIVYAADGSVIAEWHGEQDRTLVALRDMPEYLRDAVVAIEDRRFYEHDGVDFTGIGRALGANVAAGEVEQGGSTITQQLVKILYTGRERTVTRKIKEALFAYELESKNDKNAVLVTYLNTVYFGRGAYGVEAAAQRYFGKPASALDLAESATLAGIIRSPSRYGSSSVSSAAVEATTKRRDVVLRQMREQGLHHSAAGARGEGQAARVRAEQGSRRRGAVLRRVREAGPHRHARRREGLRRRPPRLHESRPSASGIGREGRDAAVGSRRPRSRARLAAPVRRAGARHDRRPGLQGQPVQPGRAGPQAARLGVQAVRARGRAPGGHRA